MSLVLCPRNVVQNIIKPRGELLFCHSREGGNPGAFELDSRFAGVTIILLHICGTQHYPLVQ